MRSAINELVSAVQRTLPIAEPIYEFGAFQVPGQEDLADLRPLFPGMSYVGCDMRQGRGVDRILNLHDIDLPDGAVGTVLCLDTLEHVEYPHRAVDEMYRIIRPGGIVLLSSVMNFEIHDYPSDYWRFTPEGFRSLLKKFDDVIIQALGEVAFPHTVVGIGFRKPAHSTPALLEALCEWKQRAERKSHFRQVVKALSPPVLLALRRRLLKSGDIRAK